MSNFVPTYLVTGATSGIGEALARRLAGCGYAVHLGSRNQESGQRALRRIRAAVPGSALHVASGDLADMTQVRALAGQVREATPRLHGIVLNAAEVRTSREPTSDGFETNVATNYLAGFLLTELLMPLLRASRPARVVMVSSSAHARVRSLDLDGLTTAPDLRHITGYPTTKLLNVLHATALAPLLDGTGVTVNVADPGFVRTGLGRHATGGFALFLKLAGIVQDSPEKATGTPWHLLTSPEVATSNGGYFARSRPGRPSPLSQDTTLAADLRERSIALLVERNLASRAEFLPGPANR